MKLMNSQASANFVVRNSKRATNAASLLRYFAIGKGSVQTLAVRVATDGAKAANSPRTAMKVVRKRVIFRQWVRHYTVPNMPPSLILITNASQWLQDFHQVVFYASMVLGLSVTHISQYFDYTRGKTQVEFEPSKVAAINWRAIEKSMK